MVNGKALRRKQVGVVMARDPPRVTWLRGPPEELPLASG